MAEENSETVVKDENKEDNAPQGLESQIQAAMRARVAHIKEQSSSLTLEGVRRLLEKDLGLEQYALDEHKRVVKQCLGELLEGSNSGNDSKNDEDTVEKRNDEETCTKSVLKEEQTESFEVHEESNDASESIDEDKEKLNHTPLSGLLKEHKKRRVETDKSEEVIKKKALTNDTITAGLRKRTKYLKANSEQLTLAGLRRLLEEDLELEPHSLDPYKKFIRDQVDEILNQKKASQPASNVKKSIMKKSQGKVAKKVKSEESSDSADSESDEDEEEVKPKKKKVMKGKESNEPKKRKRPAKDVKSSGKKTKTAEKLEENDSDEDDTGNSSEDGQPAKRKVVSAPSAYGKRVEHLKSVIKLCGMSVPPSLYKKVKQAPENERESQLIKELEEMLAKEGLSSKPSEKEIKDVRKKKERAKELEGIDTSNIVSSTRRRSTTSYVAPPKPKIPIESDSEDSEDEDDEDNDDDDDDEIVNTVGSQSEESNVDDVDSD